MPSNQSLPSQSQVQRWLARCGLSEPISNSLPNQSPKSIEAASDALTNRELETLELLSQRFCDKEIVMAMSISIWTVKSHLKHIYEKLHVNNRRQAVAQAEQLGLLTGK